MMKKRKSTTVLLVVIFMAGLSLLLYPNIANYWNAKHQTQAINTYMEAVSSIDEEKNEQLYQKAIAFNADIPNRSRTYALQEEEQQEYQELLNVAGTGVMGYIDIPAIEVSLPIYHGTSDAALQAGVGHLEWTSLPVGGSGSHCVLSGHRGLPSSRLFTDLDRIVEGDVFMIRVLSEVLTYEVDQILIVEPQDTDALQIVRDKDYCTLVTCTPYGINTHRLLVRGHRIENAEQAVSVHIASEAIQIEPMIIAFCIGIPILLLMLIFVFLNGSNEGNGSKRGKKDK